MTRLQNDIANAKKYDLSIKKSMKSLTDALKDDLVNLMAHVKEKDVDFGVYVDRYGKENPRFITFADFQEFLSIQNSLIFKFTKLKRVTLKEK